MAVEIERRFLLDPSQFERATASQSSANRRHLIQAYLSVNSASAIRIRIARDASGEERARLTVKSASAGMTRREFEYDIPISDGREMIATLRIGRVIEKERVVVEVEGFSFELDRFQGELAGLYIAEIEIPTEETVIPQPGWLGVEITGDKRFSNAALALAASLPDLTEPGEL